MTSSLLESDCNCFKFCDFTICCNICLFNLLFSNISWLIPSCSSSGIWASLFKKFEIDFVWNFGWDCIIFLESWQGVSEPEQDKEDIHTEKSGVRCQSPRRGKHGVLLLGSVCRNLSRARWTSAKVEGQPTGGIRSIRFTWMIYPPRTHNVNSIMRKHQPSQNSGTFYKTAGHSLLKYRGRESQGKTIGRDIVQRHS